MNEIVLPDTKQSDSKAMTAVEQARALTITTAAEYTAADVMCTGLKELEKEIITTFKEPKEKAWSAHKAIVAAEAKHLEPVQQARKIIKSKMSEWQEAEEKRRCEEEARLQAEANKLAEEQALKAAEEAQKAGDTAQAEAILAAPVSAPPLVLPSAAPKVKTVIQTRWTFRIVDVKLIPREYLIPDTNKIGAVVRATKGGVKIPGVEAFSQRV
jgi:hypothetical protein